MEETELQPAGEVEVKNFKVTAKKKVHLKHDGIATDFVEASTEGKEIKPFRKKQLFKETDSVEEMEESTVELIADSSRKLLARVEEEENNRIEELVNNTYTPRKSKKKISESKMVRDILNII